MKTVRLLVIPSRRSAMEKSSARQVACDMPSSWLYADWGSVTATTHLNRRMTKVLIQNLWLKSMNERQWLVAGIKQVTVPVPPPPPNLNGQETVLVKLQSTSQPGLRKSVKVKLKPSHYSPVGH
ncbi:hypothetical protein CSKR_111563 [Clonorchis sinensis]|uniref:Uncharacterized protein n=1 Tax=Clonorchis sinensis TaxID=79923 RepID=A0A3R7H0T9_CLOSI|nr:hypothetical protein CSKR_111563 [Clonorchis sinensis]